MQISDLIALRNLAGRLFAPLDGACASPEAAARLLAELGYLAPKTVAAFERMSPALVALGEIFNAIDDLPEDASPPEVAEAGGRALRALAVIIDRVNGLAAQIETDFADAPILAQTDIVAEIAHKLLDYLIVRLLETYYATLGALLNLLGVIETETIDEPPSEFEAVYVKRTIHWHKLPDLIHNPIGMMVANLTSNEAVLVYRVLYFVGQFGVSLGLPAGFRSPEEQVLRRFNGNADLFAREDADELMTVQLPFTTDPSPGIGLEVYPLVEAATGRYTGLGLAFRAGAQLDIPLTEAYRLQIKTSANVGDSLGIRIPHNGDISVIANLLNAPTELAKTATFGITFSIVPAEPDPTRKLFALGSPDGTRLEIGSGSLRFGAEKRDILSLFVEADLRDGLLSFKTPGADGFISSIVPKEGITAPINLAVGIANDRGFYFRGGSGLAIRLPLQINLGAIDLHYVGIGVSPGDDSLAVVLTAGLSAKFGPVSVAVEEIGVQAVARIIPDRTGNLGPVDIAMGFTSPTGIGLSIEAPTVAGGGFLGFEPQKQTYSGMLELVVAETIAVKATGLLVTRLPGGLKGYALLVLITAEGFKPVPLPLGFRLTGIGGLLAVNRTFDEAALRAGLKSGSLESVMFPRDPIGNASQILGNLDRLFPPASGHYLFGPMARIEWGTPTLFTADLALVLEFGARLRLLLLARVQAVLPKPEHDLVRLQMNGLGVVDVDQGTAALDATLYDSRLLKKFVLTGDMAMRLKWETSPHFALAVGGLHPAFNPPPGFPALERIALNLTAGDNPRFRCEAYFALTANTVQFGARAELYAAAHGFSLQGETGFDVLIQLDPFQFLADFHAQVQLKRGSTNLFKVRVEGALAGPRPLHLKAKATFEVLWWDVSIRVDKTLIEGEKPPPPAPVEVLPRLKAALSDPANWRGSLPAGERPMVTLRPRASSAVLLHPLGTLSVKQGVVPLDLEISRFGPAAPAGARRFSISRVSRGGQPQTPEPVRDFFAPAQFFEMSDEAKLSRPSFEPMTAGVAIGSKEIVFSADPGDWLEVPAIEFETLIVDKATGETRASRPQGAQGEPVRYPLSAALLGRQARFGAAGASGLRRSGRAKYRGAVGKYRVAKVGWQIVATEDLAVPPLPGLEAGRPATYSEAAQALAAFRRREPAKAAGLKILRASELL